MRSHFQRFWRAVGVACLAWALAGCAATLPTDASAPERWTNTLGMVFVRVPAGSFTMGGIESAKSLARDYPSLEPARFAQLQDEGPAHTVHIRSAFYLGQHEVTVGQFRRFLEQSGHQPESEADGTGGYGYNPDYDPSSTPRGDAFEGRSPRYSWRNPGFVQTDQHPVVNVSWNDAQAMARWLSATEGRRYRLPTEAEWEYACRAGTRSRYPHGDDPTVLATHANLFDQRAALLWPRWRQHAVPGDDGYAFTAPVGNYPANAWGLHDMVGNAWEWVQDWHDDHAYTTADRTDPQGPSDGSVRVRRGGSWHTWAFYARCGFRNWNTPSTRYPLVGFRLLLEAPVGTPR
ncbi:MAG: formylglycine-generating enzyme family protein [Burkholderiaceae bacterium]